MLRRNLRASLKSGSCNVDRCNLQVHLYTNTVMACISSFREKAYCFWMVTGWIAELQRTGDSQLVKCMFSYSITVRTHLAPLAVAFVLFHCTISVYAGFVERWPSKTAQATHKFNELTNSNFQRIIVSTISLYIYERWPLVLVSRKLNPAQAKAYSKTVRFMPSLAGTTVT